MENLLFLGVPILKHIRVVAFPENVVIPLKSLEYCQKQIYITDL